MAGKKRAGDIRKELRMWQEKKRQGDMRPTLRQTCGTKVLIVRVRFPVQVQLRQLVLTVRGVVNIRKVRRTRG
jgi:hypothetical protein